MHTVHSQAFDCTVGVAVCGFTRESTLYLQRYCHIGEDIAHALQAGEQATSSFM
jgi:hypothetical protein